MRNGEYPSIVVERSEGSNCRSKREIKIGRYDDDILGNEGETQKGWLGRDRKPEIAMLEPRARTETQDDSD